MKLFKKKNQSEKKQWDGNYDNASPYSNKSAFSDLSFGSELSIKEKKLNDKNPLNKKTVEMKYTVFAFSQRSDLYLLIPAIFISAATAIAAPALTILIGRVFGVLGDFVGGKITKHVFISRLRLESSAIIMLGAGFVIVCWVSISLWVWIDDRQVKQVRRHLFQTYMKKTINWYDLNKQVMGDLSAFNRYVFVSIFLIKKKEKSVSKIKL